MRNIIIFAFALLFGLGAAFFANTWLNLQIVPVQANTEPERTLVIVAAQDLPMGKRIDTAWVKAVEWPADGVPPNSFTKMEDVSGKVVREQIYAGEVVVSSRLTSHEKGSAMSSVIEISKRAVTVRVDDVIGVAGFILPGNFVDVLATRVRNKVARTSTILQNMKVLAVDQRATTNKDEPVLVRAVTLEATPRQTEQLIKSESEGSIQLALRNTLDRKPIPEAPKPVVQAVTKAEPKVIVKTKTVYVAAKPKPAKKKAVAIFRGTPKEIETQVIKVPRG